MKTAQTIDIIMADDHEIFRDGFAAMFRKPGDVRLVADARNGRQLVSLVEKHNPDVVFADIKMPDMDGIEATRIISQSWPHIKVIALSMYDDEHLIIDMLEAGAIGYVQKNAHKKEIMEAIRTVSNNLPYYCNHTSAALAKLIGTSRFHPDRRVEKVSFSDRETEIIHLICRQFSNQEIAETLHLSRRTVEGHRERIMEKMLVRNIAGIVIYAIRHGIFKP